MDSFAEKSQSKRRGWMPVKVDGYQCILPNSLAFFNGRLPNAISGRGFIKFTSFLRPGKEWVVPSSVVNIKEELVKIPIVNYFRVELRLRRHNFCCVSLRWMTTQNCPLSRKMGKIRERGPTWHQKAILLIFFHKSKWGRSLINSKGKSYFNCLNVARSVFPCLKCPLATRPKPCITSTLRTHDLSSLCRTECPRIDGRDYWGVL